MNNRKWRNKSLVVYLIFITFFAVVFLLFLIFAMISYSIIICPCLRKSCVFYASDSSRFCVYIIFCEVGHSIFDNIVLETCFNFSRCYNLSKFSLGRNVTERLDASGAYVLVHQ